MKSAISRGGATRSVIVCVVTALWILSANSSSPGEEPKTADNAGARPAKAEGKRMALLVGCGKYDNFPADSLQGPPHDIVVLKNVLQKYYQFKDIRVLTDSDKPDERPTAANIRSEFIRLARDSRPGDRVFISLSGHGSQQPAVDDPQDTENFEQDGLDEIFLPVDVKPTADHKSVENVVTDNQIRDWLKDIRTGGAAVFIVFDACHSASMSRSYDREHVRKLDPKKLTSEKAIDEARTRAFDEAEGKRGSKAKRSPFRLPPEAPDLVAIYAAQSSEPTVEMQLPDNSRDAETYGLLTYTMCKVMSETDHALTYTELVERIHSHYRGMDKEWPTPLVEGRDKDMFLFSDEQPADRPPFTLSRKPDDRWMVDAGEFQGVTIGSIFEVYSPPDKDRKEKVIGHLRVVDEQADPLESLVEPYGYRNLPEPNGLTPGMRCKPVYIDYQIADIKLAVDPLMDTLAPSGGGKTVSRPLEAAELAELRAEVEQVGQRLKLVQAVDDARQAKWLVRRVDSSHGSRLYLIPGSGDVQGDDPGKRPALFGPIPRDKIADWLVDRMTRIGRAQNLLRIADQANDQTNSGSDELGLDVKILRLKNRNDPQGEPIEWSDEGIILYDGQMLGVQIANTGDVSVDVSILYIDSGYGIEPFFPRSRGADNRLDPKDPPLRLQAKVNADTTGLEHLVVIAVKSPSEGLPADFTFLKSPTIEQARGGLRGVGDNSLDSPLGKLLQTGLYAQGATRGLDAADASTSTMRAFHWRVKPKTTR